MKAILYAGLAALVLTSGQAFAQATYDSTTTTQTAPAVPPPIPAPPQGTLSTTREHHAVDAYGNQTDSKSTTYRNEQGVAEDSATTTTTTPPPPPPPVSTTTTTTSTTTTPPQ